MKILEVIRERTRDQLRFNRLFLYRYLWHNDDTMIRGSCHRVVGFGGNALDCYRYETSALSSTHCANRSVRVPLVYHAVGRENDPPFSVRSNAAANPEFRLHYLNDTGASHFVRRCGQAVYEAYRCFRAPAFRADIFRFCALYHQGGIYLDTDLFLLDKMSSVYSACSNVSMGYDFPWGGKTGKQMKILAAAPRMPLFKCMLERIVQNVRHRLSTSPLSITGPALLHECYTEHPNDVALTYIDTRGANWPYSGMRSGTHILAYEKPGRAAFGVDNPLSYESLQRKNQLYLSSCTIPYEQPPLSTAGSVPAKKGVTSSLRSFFYEKRRAHTQQI